MNQESQNSLLKILEEPKGKTILILITSYPNALLPTIISRVQKLRFFPEKKQEEEDYKETISDFLKLLKSDLSFRFKYVKNLSDESKKGAADTLNIWTFYLRTVLIKKLNNQEFEERNNFKDYSLKRMAKIISSLQSTCHLLTTTNINPKLAIEALLIEI
jgi:DNA polymerase-3 subunit delta'